MGLMSNTLTCRPRRTKLALAAAAADAFASSIVSRSMKASKIISLAMLPYPLLVSTHTYMAAHTCMLHHIDGFWVA
jgi:hypothetical protein